MNAATSVGGQTTGRRLVLRGPLEQDIQAVILESLGAPQVYQMIDKRGVHRWMRTGLYLSRRGMFWRANSGMAQRGAAWVRLSPRGTADILGIVGGVPIGIEVKRPGEKQNDAQRDWQAGWEERGGEYAVVTSASEAREFVRRLEARA